MDYAITTIERNAAIVGWRVTLTPSRDVTATVIVMAGELPVIECPTEYQIVFVARSKLAPAPVTRKTRKSCRTKWTAAHDACQHIANQYSIDVDAVVANLPAARQSLLDEWTSTELARQTARDISGLTPRDISRMENNYLDCSSVTRFDEIANEMAERHPELHWTYGDDNGAKLWELLKSPIARKPGRLSRETIKRAAEFAIARERGEVEFAEWTEESSWDMEKTSEPVPF